MNGTFFRSDIAIFNYRESLQNVVLQWLPQGQSGLGETIAQIGIPGRSGIISEDFVTSILNRSGLGAIVVTAITVVDPRQWVAYGSSIDNVTGDGWSSLGVATVLTQ